MLTMREVKLSTEIKAQDLTKIFDPFDRFIILITVPKLYIIPLNILFRI